MRRDVLQWILVTLATPLAASQLAASAQAAPGPATPSPSLSDATPLDRARQSVVGLQARATDGARSAQTLGRERSGSGVVISADGLILTIGYLVLEAENVLVTLSSGRSLPARVVAYDLATGFGLVRPVLPMRGIPPAPLGRSGDLEPGAPLLAATGAQPDEEADADVTRLISRRPFSGYWEYHIESALFTSPPVGNHSGAPLFNARGELVGIGSLFVNDAAGTRQRLPGNMFVPIDLLRPALAEMERTGVGPNSRRPWLGVNATDQAGLVQIVRVTPDSPAAQAGLRAGDVVQAVDDEPVTTLEAFYRRLWDRPTPQTEVRLTVMQGALVRTLRVQPVDRVETLRRPAGI